VCACYTYVCAYLPAEAETFSSQLVADFWLYFGSFLKELFFKSALYTLVVCCCGCKDVVNTALGKLLPTSSSVNPPTLQFCTLLNISYCSVTETSQQVQPFISRCGLLVGIYQIPRFGIWLEQDFAEYQSMSVCWRIHTRACFIVFNGPFSGTTQVSWYQKGKTNLDFTEARDSEWQWHQLDHM